MAILIAHFVTTKGHVYIFWTFVQRETSYFINLFIYILVDVTWINAARKNRILMTTTTMMMMMMMMMMIMMMM